MTTFFALSLSCNVPNSVPSTLEFSHPKLFIATKKRMLFLGKLLEGCIMLLPSFGQAFKPESFMPLPVIVRYRMAICEIDACILRLRRLLI
jgi:hypothetical protein